VTELLFLELKVCSAGTPVLDGVDRSGAARAWHPITQLWCEHPGDLMPFPSQPAVSPRLHVLELRLPIPVEPDLWLLLRQYLDVAANVVAQDAVISREQGHGGALVERMLRVRDVLRDGATRCLVTEPDDGEPEPAGEVLCVGCGHMLELHTRDGGPLTVERVDGPPLELVAGCQVDGCGCGVVRP